ncbi:hypothetical protein CPC08DRAFT_729896 [Agrocybe pediades]|nr:hypothetical protein CPC08DRAFT_729896 [Agrocybe pediades]
MSGRAKAGGFRPSQGRHITTPKLKDMVLRSIAIPSICFPSVTSLELDMGLKNRIPVLNCLFGMSQLVKLSISDYNFSPHPKTHSITFPNLKEFDIKGDSERVVSILNSITIPQRCSFYPSISFAAVDVKQQVNNYTACVEKHLDKILAGLEPEVCLTVEATSRTFIFSNVIPETGLYVKIQAPFSVQIEHPQGSVNEWKTVVDLMYRFVLKRNHSKIECLALDIDPLFAEKKPMYGKDPLADLLHSLSETVTDLFPSLNSYEVLERIQNANPGVNLLPLASRMSPQYNDHDGELRQHYALHRAAVHKFVAHRNSLGFLIEVVDISSWPRELDAKEFQDYLSSADPEVGVERDTLTLAPDW